MSEPVLDAHALAQPGPASRRGEVLAEALLEPFVLGDVHGAPVPGAAAVHCVRSVQWSQASGSDQPGVEVGGDVPLEAVEALRLALAPMAHLRVADRDTPIRRYALADLLAAAVGVRLQVLIHELLEGRQVVAKRRLLHLLREVRGDAFLKTISGIAPSRLVLVDETGTHTSMTREYARGPSGDRVVGIVPRRREAIETTGARALYLSPHHPELNPIELAWSKLKALLNRIGARDLHALATALKHTKDLLTPSDMEGWYRHCGYEALAQCA